MRGDVRNVGLPSEKDFNSNMRKVKDINSSFSENRTENSFSFKMHTYTEMKSQVEKVLEREGGSYMMDFGMPAPENYAADPGK